MSSEKLVSHPKNMKSISCKEAVHYMLVREEGRLPLLKRISLWRHLAICSLCRTFAFQNKLMNAAIKQSSATSSTLTEAEKEKMIGDILNSKPK